MRELIVPVILSGGSRSPLWPPFGESSPKQLLPEASMLQATWQRVATLAGSGQIVAANVVHRFPVADQLREIGTLPRAVRHHLREAT